MNKEKGFFKTCFNTVASLEVTNESQAIAKEVVLSEVENLQQENQQLKKELKSKPDAEITLQDDKGNKFMIIQTERIDMQEELNKIIQKLFNNWNELKNIIKDMASVGYIDKCEGEYWATGWNSEYGVRAKILLSKMEELEQGSDSNEI